MKAPVSPVEVQRVQQGEAGSTSDLVVTEEPLEIRLGHGQLEDRQEHRVSVTMRTPGRDEELAIGYLFTEGIIANMEDVVAVRMCENVRAEERGNVVRVELSPAIDPDPASWQRNFYTTSSCGVCGKSSIEAIKVTSNRSFSPFALKPSVILGLPEAMRKAQTVFERTGGIHAAALATSGGEILLVREDVGRHNAVDKVIGAMLQQQIPSDQRILVVSGRAGFELVQKCAVAGIPAMVAVGAPSSLAVQLALEAGITLIGFLRGDRFNVYSGSIG